MSSGYSRVPFHLPVCCSCAHAKRNLIWRVMQVPAFAVALGRIGNEEAFGGNRIQKRASKAISCALEAANSLPHTADRVNISAQREHLATGGHFLYDQTEQ
jgi:hypothetical protein